MSDGRGPSFVRPEDIETRSFRIIGEELGPHDFDPLTELVVKRVIHASADFDYARTLYFSGHAIERGVAALAAGATIACDTTMVAAGINKRVVARFGGTVRTFIADPDVAEEARRRGVTRSVVSMERAAGLEGPLVLAVGNAPTALMRLSELLEDGMMEAPALVVGVPVGFVNVVESKEQLMRAPVEHIVARGRKGGSTIAAAIVNALLYIASGDRRD